jgi:hypothetical protein
MAGIAAAVDSTIQGATRNHFTGVLAPFLRAGFIELVPLTPDRSLVWRKSAGQ